MCLAPTSRQKVQYQFQLLTKVIAVQCGWLCRYWSVTTISTVGYGDIAPTEYRPLFACFFLVAVVLFASLLGETVALVTELGNYRRLSALFENGLGPEALAKMDSYQGDGRVRLSLYTFPTLK